MIMLWRMLDLQSISISLLYLFHCLVTINEACYDICLAITSIIYDKFDN